NPQAVNYPKSVVAQIFSNTFTSLMGMKTCSTRGVGPPRRNLAGDPPGRAATPPGCPGGERKRTHRQPLAALARQCHGPSRMSSKSVVALLPFTLPGGRVWTLSELSIPPPLPGTVPCALSPLTSLLRTAPLLPRTESLPFSVVPFAWLAVTTRVVGDRA